MYYIGRNCRSIVGGIPNSELSYGTFTLNGNVSVTPLSALAASVMYFELLALQGQQAPAAGAPPPPGATPPPSPAGESTSAPPPPAPPQPPPPREPPPAQGQ